MRVAPEIWDEACSGVNRQPVNRIPQILPLDERVAELCARLCPADLNDPNDLRAAVEEQQKMASILQATEGQDFD